LHSVNKTMLLSAKWAWQDPLVLRRRSFADAPQQCCTVQATLHEAIEYMVKYIHCM